MILRGIIWLVLLLPCRIAFSQAGSEYIIAGPAGLRYFGDLKESNPWEAGISVGARLFRKPNFNGGLTLTIGKITGENAMLTFVDSDGSVFVPNRFFTSTVVSLNYDLTYRIIQRDKYLFYGSAGLGLLRFDPRDQDNASLADQSATRGADESYNTTTLLIPLRTGFIYYLPNELGLELQLSLLNPATDYLDNISDWGPANGWDRVASITFLVHVPVGGSD